MADQGQNPLHQFPRSNSVTGWQQLTGKRV